MSFSPLLRETSGWSFEIAAEKTTQHPSILAPVSERNREPRNRLGVNSRRSAIPGPKPNLIRNIQHRKSHAHAVR